MALQTPLYYWHRNEGARLVDFGGWDMPVVYSSIVAEHNACRTGAGLFDISHMGRLVFAGAGAEAFLERVLTNAVATLADGQVRYSLVLNDAGCVLDDVLVGRTGDGFLMVVNAGNRDKLLAWFGKQMKAGGEDVTLRDRTAEWAMIAVQGPKALELVAPLSDVDPESLKYYHMAPARFGEGDGYLSRTGYTGEDGVEIILPAHLAEQTWTTLTKGGWPVGLAARDTLRLEASMPLYGHELTEQIDPVQAGLGWAVKGAEKDFVGKDALAARDADRPVRVGLKLAEPRRIPREAYPIHRPDDLDDGFVGTVTSGAPSPTLGHPIAMAYVLPAAAAVGTELAVMIRNKPAAATVVKMPFYRRTKPTTPVASPQATA